MADGYQRGTTSVHELSSVVDALSSVHVACGGLMERVSPLVTWHTFRMLSEFTGLPMERVEEECDRENYLSPAQAMEFGIIDGVIAR